MAKSHNKKRNIGIIYEQIINFICGQLMEENKETAEKAVKIIKNHFNKDSQLLKEYRLFKALSTTHNTTSPLASSIINEAKKACNHMFDSSQLEREKSNLIKDLNYAFGKGLIFETKVKNYRIYATIQTLLNEWRNELNNFDKATEYEVILHESLTKKVLNEKPVNKPVKVDSLTYKIMKEMFSKKYESSLNETQKELISLFIKDKEENLTNKYFALKKSVDTILENYISNCNNAILIEKYNRISQQINNLDHLDTTKENLEKFLTLGKLKEEVLGD